ncbi:MAG TPA: PAS domain S-box protein [Opitutaceae bacterium]
MRAWLAANIDYLLFTCLSVVAFGGVAAYLRRGCRRACLPRLMWLLIAGLLAVGWFVVDAAGRRRQETVQTILEGVAPTYAQELSRLGHAGLTLDTPADDPRYLAMIEAQKRWLAVNPVISDIYTFRRLADGRVVLFVDSETDYDRDGRYAGAREARTPIGEVYQPVTPALERAFAGESNFMEEPVTDRWGRWVSVHVPMRDAAGRVEAVLGVDYPALRWFADVRERRLAAIGLLAVVFLIFGGTSVALANARAQLQAREAIEGALRESEARLRTIFRNLPFTFWVTDTEGRYTFCNEPPGCAQLEILGRTVDELGISEDWKAEWKENDRRALRGEIVKTEVSYEIEGRRRYLYKVIAPIIVEERITGTLGVELDITDRVEAEVARRRSEEKLALHVSQTPLAVIELDLDCRVTAWNPAAERIFGYPADEAVGRPVVELIVTPEGRGRVEGVWRALMARTGGTRSTNENCTKDGRLILCEWYNTPLIAADGTLVGVASHVQDVTERMTLEKQLRQAQKMESMGQLAGGVAHEFNNLLTPMMVQVSLLADQYPDDRRLLAALRPLKDAIQQAAQLNQRILAIGRKTSDQRERLALNPLVENAVSLLRHTLDRRIQLDLELAPDLEHLEISKGAISQIVMNLALNARDSLLEKLPDAPKGWTPRLVIRTLRAYASHGSVGSTMPFPQPCQCLRVIDNGGGMTPQTRQRIFEPFFTTKAPGKGTGLGLAMVWNVVDTLGGWIEVESEPGVGCTFNIYLPIPSAPPSALVESVAAAASNGLPIATVRRRHVLIVDDNALVMETFRAVLERAGHRVTCAVDGEEAWRLLQQPGAGIDVVLADLNMPRLSGSDLLVRARALPFTGRFIIVSGLLPGEHAEELRRLGVDEILRKPIGATDVLAAVAPVASSPDLPVGNVNIER